MSENGKILVTEADLHAYADGQLPEPRRSQVEAFLAGRPEERARVDAWVRDNQALRALLDPVLDEPIPVRLPLAPGRRVLPWRQFAMAASIAFVSAAAGWLSRGMLHEPAPQPLAGVGVDQMQSMAGFARRAAVAHVVYSPDVRRPVELGADQEDQLVAWLSKRLNAPLKPPHLGRVGYELIGGRLLPGEQGPVAQFMYHDPYGQRLTLYVTREAAAAGDTAFRFAQDGPVNVFYWVDGRFGYAISAGAGKNVLHLVAQEVYRQLAPTDIDQRQVHEGKSKP
ncbi:MAG: anti-sigma factor [Betaproteobacteria bacterium]|nr:MAG: anti-sigma factor [Betaproteobacteria bacterium]